jgi:hypothetical protein
LAHQHLDQLPTALRHAVLANCRSRILFQLSAGDARVFARELAPHLTAADLQGLGAHEVVAQLSVGAETAAPATGRTLPLSAAAGTASVARHRSRERYGMPREVVEAAIRSRHDLRPGPGPVGRRAS